MSKRLCKYIAAFDYFDKHFIGAPAAIASASFSFSFSLTIEITRKPLKVTRNTKKA